MDCSTAACLGNACRVGPLILALALLARPGGAAAAPPEGLTPAWRVDDTTFHVPVPDDGSDTALPATWRGWWYVRLDVPTDKPVHIEVDRIGWEHPYLPWVSYDQCQWQHVAAGEVVRHGTESMTVTRAFPHSPVYVAQRQPYTARELAALGGALAAVPVPVAAEILGTTPEGRPLWMFTVGDAAAAKGRVWVHARVHPGEPQASWMADGMLRFLAGDSAAARDVRARLLFHVVPVLNADGVALGHYRTNARGENLEPLWDVDAPPQEVGALRAAIARLGAEGPPWVAALNLHSSHAAAAQPPFSFPHFGPEALGYTADEARLWAAQHALIGAAQAAYAPLPLAVSEAGTPAAPAPAGRSFLAAGMPERWWWREYGSAVLATTVEAVDGEVGYGGRWYAAADAQALGAALAVGLGALAAESSVSSRQGRSRQSTVSGPGI